VRARKPFRRYRVGVTIRLPFACNLCRHLAHTLAPSITPPKLMRRSAPFLLALSGLLVLSGCVVGDNLFELAVNPFAGICTLIVLILNIVAIVEILGSTRDTVSKVIWIAALFFLPVVGLILYYFFGR
jgi:hypothetical protein